MTTGTVGGPSLGQRLWSAWRFLPLLLGLRARTRSSLTKLDPAIHFARARLAAANHLDFDLHVLVLIKPGGFRMLEAVEFRMTSYAGGIVAGYIPANRLDDLAALAAVEYVEGSRRMSPQLERSIPEIFASEPTEAPSERSDSPIDRTELGSGDGVIVGIIDGGICYGHSAFRDAQGRTRILALWDHGFEPDVRQKHEKHPQLRIHPEHGSRESYGVLYEQVDINRELAAGCPGTIVRHVEMASRHGSKVAGIAAGNGRDGERGLGCAGVAPDADLLVVSAAAWPSGLPHKAVDDGDWFIESTRMFDAANFLRGEAIERKRPIVINISHNDNCGPHDGTSLLERGLSEIGGDSGCIIVVSAGNNYRHRRHVAGIVGANTIAVPLIIKKGCAEVDYVDIWYEGDTEISVAIQPPMGAPNATVATWHAPASGDPSPRYESADRDTRAAVYSVTSVKINNSHRIGLSLISANADSRVTPGAWTILLKAKNPTPFHAWIGGPSADFMDHSVLHYAVTTPDGPRSIVALGASAEFTVMTPGCADNVLTVGAYQMNQPEPRSLTPGSASGPTRDKRQKPELCAPSDFVRSVVVPGGCSCNDTGYGALFGGTSCAAPHVAGTVALMLARKADLTCTEVRARLADSCRQPSGSSDSNRWGKGMLHAADVVRGL